MNEWKLHIPTEENLLPIYRCGLHAGKYVKLRKDLVIFNRLGNPTGAVFGKGEVWQVLPGIESDPVLWFRRKDGDRHTWDDDAGSVQEWFEVVGQV